MRAANEGQLADGVNFAVRTAYNESKPTELQPAI